MWEGRYTAWGSLPGISMDRRLPLMKGILPGMLKPKPVEPLVNENSALLLKKGSSTMAF